MLAKKLFHKAVLTYLYDKPLNEETSLDIYTGEMPEIQIISLGHGHLK